MNQSCNEDFFLVVYMSSVKTVVSMITCCPYSTLFSISVLHVYFVLCLLSIACCMKLRSLHKITSILMLKATFCVSKLYPHWQITLIVQLVRTTISPSTYWAKLTTLHSLFVLLFLWTIPFWRVPIWLVYLFFFCRPLSVFVWLPIFL